MECSNYPDKNCLKCHGTGKDPDYMYASCRCVVTGEAYTRNSEVLADFAAYCQEHPQERFWQALRNWIPKETGYHFIFVSTLPQYEYEPSGESLVDTFYWEGKNE